MAGILKQLRSSFTVTPHKVSVCILVQIYATPGPFFLPEIFSSVSHHNSFGLFLVALIKSYDDIMEPKLDKLLSQLREIGGMLDQRLTHRLSSLSSPDELFNFFTELQGILGGQDSSVIEDDQISLDPSSNLGMFLRRCILTFNELSFEGICHLLSDLESYCKEVLSGSPSFDLTRLDGCTDESDRLVEYEKMDLDSFAFQEATEKAETSNRAGKGISFHLHVPKVLDELVEGVEVSAAVKHSAKAKELSPFIETDALDKDDDNAGKFLHSNWQVYGYLLQKADEIEKHGSSFPLNTLESDLKQLHKLAPELHRVHFLRYLNMLHHDDYSGALENLHRYFDHSAGMEGFDLSSSSTESNCFGKYEIALLCCGMMHVHFGHPKLALEALTEAVRASQQHSNDACLAYTLTVICNLLSEFGITSASRILGSSYSPMTSIGSSLTIHQQLYVLLRRALARSEGLKLTPLVSANHLAMAKFDLMHVQRSMLSFGPKASVSLRTRPADVFQELRLSSHVVSEFSNEASAMSRDGDFATAWLKNPLKPMGPLMINSEIGSGSDCSTFEFCAQQSSIPKSVLQQLGSSFLLRTTAWEMYGSNSLARINALIYATCFADASSLDNLALACVKLVQQLAAYKGYREAYVAFGIVEKKFHVISKSRVLLLKLQLLHEHALHRGHLNLAQQVCDELGALASPVIGVDVDIKTEASLRRARTLLAANQFSQAAQVAQSLFCTCYKFNLQVENATVLLLLAEIHKKSGNATLGLPYALACILFCQSFNLDLLKASATLTLAELWLSFGPTEAHRALSLLHGIFPMILGHGGLELRARAHIIEAKCHLSDANYSVSQTPEAVLNPLKEACEELELLEYHELAAEAYYLMAMVYDKLGSLQEREIAAASFKDHTTASKNPQDSDDDTLNSM
ncbi:anaphase-promoting complex subunit 5-like isoform X1 [Chenopodium quinoa]|uniref:anaphase-promoting complex subunit 5-like isoform X1 n=1 Tax=Chenopodium quinoa TaxID=63459 RepID=UPI000B777B72|nr:anaphase-promoting complex subunit 5-like isoform X1 [Chenopodium quinoa]